MWERGKTVEPYEIDDGQDMWITEIHYYPRNKVGDDTNHEGAVEIRAFNKEQLEERFKAVMFGLSLLS